MTRYNLTCRLDNNAEKALYYPGGDYCKSSYNTVYAYIYDSITVDSLFGYGVGPGGFDATTGAFTWYTTPDDLGYAPGDWVRSQTIHFYYYNDSRVYQGDDTVNRTLSTSYTVPSYWDSGYRRCTVKDSLVQAESISGGGYPTKNAVKVWTRNNGLRATLIGSTSYSAYSQTMRSAISKTGYTQTGGYCFSGPYAGNTYSVSGGFDVYAGSAAGYTEHYFEAVYSANTFYVKYNGNGATSGSMSNSTFKYDATNKLTSNGYSRTGYEFKGWATSKARADAGTVDYSNGANVGNLTSEAGKVVEIFAVWSPIGYTISYNANGGNANTVPGNQTKIHAQTLKLSTTNPTKNNDTSSKTVTYNVKDGNYIAPGYVIRTTTWGFDRWNTNSSGTGTGYAAGANYTANAAAILFAQWTKTSEKITQSVTIATGSKNSVPSAKTITYNANGGTASKTSESFNVTTNYPFNGWSGSDGKTYQPGNVYSTFADVTLTANYGTTYTIARVTLPSVTKSGSIFNGGYRSDGSFAGNAGTSYEPNRNGETLTAKWIDGTEVTFNGNGGSPATETVTFVRNTSTEFSRNKIPTRSGFYFDGGNTKSDGTGVNVYNGRNMSSCEGNLNASTYGGSSKQGIYNKTELILFAKGIPADSYVYWTDNKWHPIKAWAYNGGGKETITHQPSDPYDDNHPTPLYIYDGTWKRGNG